MGIIVGVIVLLGICGFLLMNRPVDYSSHRDSEQAESVDNENVSPILGFSLSPLSYSEKNFSEFLKNAFDGGNALTVAGEVATLSDREAGPQVVMRLSNQYGFTPVILVSDPQTDHIIPFVTEYKPSYLGIGVEVNRNKINTIEQFAADFSSIYDRIKEVSPQTIVFVTFQLENMKGLDGGLFGNSNNPENSQWDLLDLFPKSDLVGFTTYPGLIYTDPSQIPDNYYLSIEEHTDKSLAFVEIGWFSQISLADWESDEEEQSKFIERFFTLTSDNEIRMTIWSFLYDQSDTDLPLPFRSMGLFDFEGNEKLGWWTWKNHVM
ncbi:hypothetical protein KC573_01605 [candidate division WWE3 bacterium]|uniref:Uncharacterized protein n=1 Tax=candidate division WWE3 bacterium TaxID=2053526 RepID=A0A955LWI2_UNCKA|nr:hypothetical protein [candidate division WWE3 bacterium]